MERFFEEGHLAPYRHAPLRAGKLGGDLKEVGALMLALGLSLTRLDKFGKDSA